jgi:hypothetical protein
MKITLANIKSKIKQLHELIKLSNSVEEVEKLLVAAQKLEETVTKVLNEVEVSIKTEGNPSVSIGEFLQNLKAKQTLKNKLSSLRFAGEVAELERKNKLKALIEDIENQLTAYKKFIYSNEFEVDESSNETGI